MLQRPLAPFAFFATIAIVVLVLAGVLGSAPWARALPPAGVDELNVTGHVSVASRLGQETIDVTGTVEISRADPHMDGGVEVAAAEIVGLNLTGTSVTGPVTITESPALNSTGEVRSLQSTQQFPASSFFDVFVDAVIPGSGYATPASLHNEQPLHLVAATMAGWPPVGVTYQAAMAPPATPVPTPSSTPPGGVPDCSSGVPLLPVLPAGVCVTGLTITLGQPKTPQPTNTPCPPEICGATQTGTPRATLTPRPTPTPTQPAGPEDPTFSVAPGGPSGFHPADLLALSPATATVSGNDFFANAGTIATLPYLASQATTGATVEAGEPTSPAGCILVGPGTKGATVWYRYTPSSSGEVTADTFGSAFDTVLAVYTGSAVNALSLVACNDDTTNLQSQVTFSVIAGTTYRLQAGGYAGVTGELTLNVHAGGPAGTAGPPFVRITCAHLGLTPAGCGASAPQDDIDGLSFGADFGGSEQTISFSVAPGSQGLAGTAVAAQAACSPAQPQADEFSSALHGSNSLVFDGDGLSNGCPTGPELHLQEVPTSDNVDALNEQSPAYVDTNGDGIPDNPVFFSLAAGSPTLATLSRSPADILWTVGGFQPGLYASASTLGLVAGDDIDGLCIKDVSEGAPAYDPATDTVYFSLAPGSPTLATLGASAADVLRPGPQVVSRASDLGLRASDNVDAMKCAGASTGPHTVTVLVGDIWYCNPLQPPGVVCETKVNVGDTVLWDFTAAITAHTTTECGVTCDPPTTSPLWDSGVIFADSPIRTFQHTFTLPGVYLYMCRVHPLMQRGRIVVNAPGDHLGDVNCDSQVTSVDAALLLQFGASLLAHLGCQQNGDVNRDGQINSVDALLVLQYVAGLLHSLPP